MPKRVHDRAVRIQQSGVPEDEAWAIANKQEKQKKKKRRKKKEK